MSMEDQMMRAHVVSPVDIMIRRGELIKQVEWAGSDALYADSESCLWCRAGLRDTVAPGKHKDTCPAFTVDGDVR